MNTKWATGLVLGLLFTAKSTRAGQSSAQVSPEGELTPITIRVYDYVQSKTDVLQKAEGSAAAILTKTGVDTVWFNCRTKDGKASLSPCDKPANATYLELRVLPESMSKHWRIFDDGGLGYSLLGEQFNCDTWVLYDRIDDLAMRKRLTFEPLLGAVVAHEVGHLLLGENVHSAGLMHGSWSHNELLSIEAGSLFFSDAESKRIQKALTVRREAASVISAAPSSPSPKDYAVQGATAQQEALVRGQIQTMQPAILPLRVVFVAHWKYVDDARIFHLHVPSGYTSALFTHLPSRTMFIDADRYRDESLGYWLAHELGHLVTNSAKEDDAERAAKEFRRRLKEHYKDLR